MARKFVTALMVVALSGLFYVTDRLEQRSTSVKVTKDSPAKIALGRAPSSTD